MPKYKQQKVRIKIPKGYTSRERKAISFEVVEFMIKRTQKGLDKDNRRLKPYSKGYKESFEFRAAGKSGKVNLTSSEEMMDEMKGLKDTDGSLDIGYDGRKNALNGKVEGNRLGTYGNKKPVVSGGRDFLGITNSDLKRILKRFPLQDNDKRIERLLRSEAALEKAREVTIGFEQEENTVS